MVGNNTLELNQATMIEIVQFWLDNKFLNKDERSPKVTAFKHFGTGYDSGFEVHLQAADAQS